MRVVHVGLHLDPSARAADELLEAWPLLTALPNAAAAEDLRVSVVQVAHEDATRRVGNVDITFVAPALQWPWPRARRLAAASAAARRVRRLDPDLVHVHGLDDPAALGVFRRSVGTVPVIVQDHGNQEPADGIRRWFARGALRSIAGVIFTSEEQSAAWIAAGVLGKTVPRYSVVEGSSHFTPGERESSRSLTGMFGDPCVLWTGRLDANKDPLVALEAFARAATRLPDARLWCCFGDAPLLGEVQRVIAASPILRERVRLLGHRPHAELAHRFRAADLFLQASHREGSGFSVIEALACGTPPVVTDIPPFRRIVGEAGSLTPVGDAAALADALVRWSARDRAADRSAARARFESEASLAAIGRQLRAVYREVLAQRAAVR